MNLSRNTFKNAQNRPLDGDSLWLPARFRHASEPCAMVGVGEEIQPGSHEPGLTPAWPPITSSVSLSLSFPVCPLDIEKGKQEPPQSNCEQLTRSRHFPGTYCAPGIMLGTRDKNINETFSTQQIESCPSDWRRRAPHSSSFPALAGYSRASRSSMTQSLSTWQIK